MSTTASAGVSGAKSVASFSSSGPLFRTLFTALKTGHSRTVPGGAGRSSSAGSPASSPQCSRQVFTYPPHMAQSRDALGTNLPS